MRPRELVFCVMIAGLCTACETSVRQLDAGPVAGGSGVGSPSGTGGAGGIGGTGGAAGAGGAGGAGGGTALCAPGGMPDPVGISSASLETSPVQLEAGPALTGAGVAAIMQARATGLVAMQWHRDGLIIVASGGFWDIGSGGSPAWMETSSMVTGAAAGDVDGDGDSDLMLLSTTIGEVNPDGTMSPIVTRLLVWERSAMGLVKRAELVKKDPGGIVGMPFAFADLEGDGDLDVVTFDLGGPVGHINDGKFAFSRKVIGATDAAYADRPAIALSVADRDEDGVKDLLVVLGGVSNFDNLVYPGDGTGGYMPHAPGTMYETTANGLTIGDVTGDGLDDIIEQQVEDDGPRLRLTASADWGTFAPTANIMQRGMGTDLVDIDHDGTLDIVTAIDERLFALVARGGGAFDTRDLGIIATTELLDLAAEGSPAGRPARLHLLYDCAAATP